MPTRGRGPSHQRSRRRRRRRRRRRSGGDAKGDVHPKETGRLREHVSMISVSANAATYHGSGGGGDGVGTPLLFALLRKVFKRRTPQPLHPYTHEIMTIFQYASAVVHPLSLRPLCPHPLSLAGIISSRVATVKPDVKTPADEFLLTLSISLT